MPATAEDTDCWQLELVEAHLRLPAALCDQYLGEISTVAVLREGGQLRIFPVHNAAQGGRLLKLRNRHGDRVVHIGDLLAGGPGADRHQQLLAHWNSAEGVLSAQLSALENQDS